METYQNLNRYVSCDALKANVEELQRKEDDLYAWIAAFGAT